MTLKGLPGVLDVRAIGIAAGIDLAPGRAPRASAATRPWSGRSMTKTW